MHAPKFSGLASSPPTVPHSPRIRWRGGAKSDPGTATCDASVDLEMFCSASNDGAVAIATRHLVPDVCSNWMHLEDGQLARAGKTCGDGACSLHALWGSVTARPPNNEYYREDARANVCNAMPVDVHEILNSRCGAALRVLLHYLWSDVVGYRTRQMQQEAVWPGNCLLVFWGGGLC